jgi:hypothetical protein
LEVSSRPPEIYNVGEKCHFRDSPALGVIKLEIFPEPAFSILALLLFEILSEAPRPHGGVCGARSGQKSFYPVKKKILS